MVQANYHTLFEIGFRSFPWTAVLRPLIFVAIGLVVVKLVRGKPIYLVMGVFMASMATVFFLVSLITFIPQFFEARSAYVSGKSSVVEGVVKNFRPAPKLGRARESFTVGRVSFTYNALDVTPCFHDAPQHRGPIRDGLAVRIYYINGCIQRIDVLRGENSNQR